MKVMIVVFEETSESRHVIWDFEMHWVFVHEGPVFMCGDNMSASCNTTEPESALKKKCQSIACHLTREGVARDEWITAYANNDENESDLLKKTLPNGEKRKNFVRRLLDCIFRSDEHRSMGE